MKPSMPWHLDRARRYCPDCYRPLHDGECERPFAFPGWNHTDCPTWPPAKPVERVSIRGGLL